jgi:hypothetical protein
MWGEGGGGASLSVRCVRFINMYVKSQLVCGINQPEPRKGLI